MFAWYVFPLRSALNLWSVLNLWSAFPLRYVEYDICVACVNFPSLGDKGLEWYIDGPSIDDLHTDLPIDIYMFFIAMSISESLTNL